MKLYELVKDRLKEPKGVISDNEMVVLNRRDFLYSETSTTNAFLNLYNSEHVTYEMYSIIDFIYATVCKIRPPMNVRVYQLSKSMTLPTLAASAFIGDLARDIKICAPRGIQPVQARDQFSESLLSRFRSQLNSGLTLSDLGKTNDSIELIFCNASNEAEVSSGLKAFENVKRGLILIKGYGRFNAPNCGEIILSARLNVHCTLAGFGFCLAI